MEEVARVALEMGAAEREAEAMGAAGREGGGGPWRRGGGGG